MKLNRRQVIKAGLAASTVYSPWMLGIAQSRPVILGQIFSASSTAERFSAAYVDAMEFHNLNGGINGRRLEVVVDSGNADVSKSPEALNRLLTRAPDTLMLYTASTAMTQVLAPEIQKQKLPCIPFSYHASFANPEKHPTIFLNGPTFDHNLLALLPGIKRLKNNATVAIVYSDSPYGKDSLPPFKAQAAKDGTKIVAEIMTPQVLPPDGMAPLVAKLQEANADFVVLQGYLGTVEGPTIKAARAAGVKSVFMGVYGSTHINLLQIAGAAAADGYIGSNHTLFHTEDNPGIEAIRKFRTSRGRENNHVILDNGYLYEWYLYAVMVEAFRRADAAGKLTRQGIVETMENGMGDSTAGGLYRSLKFVNHCLPYTRLHRLDAAGQRFVPISDWMNLA